MPNKKILIINGHPDKESFCFALSAAYLKGAAASGAKVKEINIRDLQFNPNLEFGYRARTNLEPGLMEAQENILWAEHLVWVYPVWWGSYPAIMKGFIDRVLLPGFAFKKRPNSLWWDKLLKNKSALLISTLDQPAWFYWLVNRQPSNHSLKKLTLKFCGISPVMTVNIGPIRLSKPAYREKWLRKIEKMGLQNK
jgi:NAD(P)H dehydrogenase (quinone)